MDIKQISYFIEVVNYRSFTKAARTLRVSQPTLSKSIALLEDELETALLVRDKGGIELTEAGKRFYEEGTSLLSHFNSVQDSVREVGSGDRISISFGYSDMLHSFLGINEIWAWLDSLKEYKIRYKKAKFDVLMRDVLSSELDFAACILTNAQIISDQGMRSKVIGSGRLYGVAPKMGVALEAALEAAYVSEAGAAPATALEATSASEAVAAPATALEATSASEAGAAPAIGTAAPSPESFREILSAAGTIVMPTAVLACFENEGIDLRDHSIILCDNLSEIETAVREKGYCAVVPDFYVGYFGEDFRAIVLPESMFYNLVIFINKYACSRMPIKDLVEFLKGRLRVTDASSL